MKFNLNIRRQIVIKGILGLTVVALVVLSAGWHSRFVSASQEGGTTLMLPSDYRDWRLISVAHEAGQLNDLRAVLGNDAAIHAYRDGILPFPDGTMISRLAWTYTPSPENNAAFGQEQSFVAGAPTNVQLMVKDSKRFAATGGWGFAQFKDGKAAGPDALKTCFSCHQPAKDRDYVFTRYAH